MKNFVFVMMVLVAQSSQAFDINTITVKIGLPLNKLTQPNSYSSELRLCVDIKKQQVLNSKECDQRDEVRKCQVYFYNFVRLPGQDIIEPGTKFIVLKQFGPEIQGDWSKRSAYFKVFSNLTGSDSKISNPNLIVECAQAGFFASNFSIAEIKAGLARFVDIN